MPHQYPLPAPDGEIIAWKCQACGLVVSEFRPEGEQPECTVDWRNAS